MEITIKLTEVMQQALHELEKHYQQAGLTISDSQDQLIERALQDLIARLDDESLDESEEDVIEGFHQGWQEAMTGQTRPIEDFLNELNHN